MTYQEFISEWNNDAQTIHVQTSGSTGAPKKMNVRKDRMIESAKMTCDFLGLQPGDTALLCMNLDYIGAKMMVVRSLVRQLRLIQVAPSGHPLATVDVPITFAAMVPLQVFNSLQVPEEREKLRQIKHLIIGGGTVDDVLAAQLHDFPHAVWSTYGMTETLSHIALRRLNGHQSSSWYTPLQGIKVTTNADECLVIDAPKLCDTPIVTNDIAEIRTTSTSEGQNALAFRLIGRRDNVINSGGVKIQMEELERLMRPFLTMPYMVTKRKSEKFGEIVVLMVEREDDGEGATFEEKSELPILQAIHKLLHRALPRYWEPRLYLSVDRIPMTETGKPNRALAQRMAENPDLPSSSVFAVDDK
ncbi:MAG: AMP-binding protein [Prevotella sp.]|nr:AMP-binding protein [Prevotellaceae bacterium]MDY5843121.1 AMP-binding protein [Prevotella sp.]